MLSARRAAAVAAAALCLAAGCPSCRKRRQNGEPSQQPASAQRGAAITVVASTFPCYDAARAVLGGTLSDGTAQLRLLVKPGAEVHSYDPPPSDIIAIQESDLFIYIGGESDEWIRSVLSGAGSGQTRAIALIDYARTLDEPEFDTDGGAPSGGRIGHQHSGGTENPHEADEHIWTAPDNEIRMVAAVSEALQAAAARKELGQDVSDAFARNAASYCNSVRQAEAALRAAVDAAAERFIVMADRFPFVYFADYYGLDYDAAFSGCSTAVEAGAAVIARLIDTVKAKNLPAVFAIELGNHKLADVVAESAGVPVLILQSVQNVTKDDFAAGETWVSLMERNAEALRSGLR